MTEEIIIDGMDILDCEQAKSCDCCRCKNMAYYRLNEKYTEVLNLAKQNADSNEYCLQELEKENETIREHCKQVDETNKILYQEKCELIQKNFALTQESQKKSQTICELEQENKELKEELKSYKHPDVVTLLTNWRTGELDRIHNKIANERDAYRSALEEINLILDELKQQYDYMTDYSEIKEIQDKINEVLK